MKRLRLTAQRLPRLTSVVRMPQLLVALAVGFLEFRFPRLRRNGSRTVWVGKGARRRRLQLRRNGIDTFTFYEVFIKGVYDGLLPLRSEDTVLDLGANTGMVAAYLDLKCPGVSVVAVEPETENARLVRENAPGAVLVEAAVSAEDGHASLELGGPTAHRLGTEGVPVRTVSLETLRTGRDPVTVVKCDIEGGERLLFSRPSEVLDDVRVLAIEVHGPDVLEVVDRALGVHGLRRVTQNSPLPELYLR